MKIITGVVLFAFLVYIGVLAAGNKNTAAPVPEVTTPTPTATITGYTMAEVATHNTTNSCWVVVNQNVYDLTSFASKHPGGSDKIEMNCGKDATTTFETKGGKGPHPQSARETLAQYQLGPVSQ